MKFSTKFDVILALVLAYALTCVTKGTEFISMYSMLNSQALLTTFGLIFLVIVLLGVTVRQYLSQRQRLKAAMTARRHPALAAHVKEGIQPTAFAYLAAVQPSGPENFLTPMTVVYVIAYDEDNAANVIVVPKFGMREVSLVDGARNPIDPSHDHFTFPISVPKKELLKHVPLHMIPEII